MFGIPLGLIGSYLLYRVAAGERDLGYHLPWEAILISCFFVFVIVGLTMSYSLRTIGKQNIVETIRDDNI